MKYPLLRKIVNTKSYTGTTYLTGKRFEKMFNCEEYDEFGPTEVPFNPDSSLKFYKYKANWQNSNRLLTVEGFSGIKTGITVTAGSCLSVYYESSNLKLITVVLGSRNIEYRWKDTRRLTLWAE